MELTRRRLLHAAMGTAAAPILPRLSADFGTLMAGETEKWTKVIRVAKLTA